MTIIIFIAFISVMYGCFEGIKEKDDKLTVICSIGCGVIGFLLGLSLSSIIFNI
jgi:hypothetical protein